MSQTSMFQTQNRCSITTGNGGLILSTPFNRAFVDQLKLKIPTSDRRFQPHPSGKGGVWVISPAFGDLARQLISIHFAEDVLVPASRAINKKEMRLLDVRYIGACKSRDDGSLSAFGWSAGEWPVVFPEDVLRNWFETGSAPAAAPSPNSSFYTLLGLKQVASPDEIKTGYRRMALQWHPDRCKEPDAQERFLKIQHAYEILSNPLKRERYDAGLALEASLGKKPFDTQYMVRNMSAGGFRSPLKSGYIMAEGQAVVGRFMVEKILAWEDVTDSQGRTLVSSWQMGAKEPTFVWA